MKFQFLRFVVMLNCSMLLAQNFLAQSINAWKIQQISYVLSEDGSKQNQTTKTIYVADHAIRIEENESITILALVGDSAVLWQVLPQAKQYIETTPLLLTMAMLGIYIRCDEMDCYLDTSITQPQNQTRRIRGYRAQLLHTRMNFQEFVSAEVKEWRTRDWDTLLQAMHQYRDLVRQTLLRSMHTGTGKALFSELLPAEVHQIQKLLEETFAYLERLARQYGEPIRTETYHMGQTIVLEVLSVRRTTVSAQMFRPPAGYVRQRIGE